VDDVLPGVQLQFTPPLSLLTFASRDISPWMSMEPGSGFAVLNETEGPLAPELELLHATRAIMLTLASNSANIRLHFVILVGLI
jgi:hypothetical protein